MCAVLVAGVIWYACTRGVRVGPEEGSFVQPLLPNFFFNSFPNVDAVYRALECGLWPPRPIGQRPSRVWPGWDQSPWPRSVWSGLSRFLNVLIPTRAALPNRPL